MELKGKVVLVTGGASGIGLATAQLFAKEGCDVVIVDLNEELGKQAAADLGGRYFRVDVGSSAEWAKLMTEVGDLDIAYLNAGVTTQQGDITALTDEQYRRVMGANLDGVVFGARAVVPAIAARGGGAVVATASLAGLIAFAPDPIYTATKHAVVGLVRALAPQLSAKGITINAICPGVVDTPLVGDAGTGSRLRAAGFPLIDPSEIADAVVHAITSGETGQAYAVQLGLRTTWQFPDPPPRPSA